MSVIRCKKCRALVEPTLFGPNGNKVYTLYTTQLPNSYADIDVCESCYHELKPQKHNVDDALPSVPSR